MARFIFITGGVVSSLGKGLASAALGSLLQARGFSVRLRKLDPYLNVDPGTMSPFEHGEVFVTDDGAETDLDLGNYERFLSISLTSDHNITTVTLNRPDKMNAISPTMLSELKDALAIADSDDSISVVVLKSSGKVFCAG